MSTVEKSLATHLGGSHWRCPQCWEIQEKPVRPDPESVPAETVACNLCGAAFAVSDGYGGKYDADASVPGAATGGKRNPLALVVVAVAVAAMLFFGFHM